MAFASVLTLATAPAYADDPAPPIEPYAVLALPESVSTQVTIAEFGSLAVSTEVLFAITGNLLVSVSVEPNAFLLVPGVGHLGMAALGGDAIGYDIGLHFPGNLSEPVRLPRTSEGTATSQPVQLTPDDEIEGVIRIESSSLWTPDGDMPAPGTYVGEVILTLTGEP